MIDEVTPGDYRILSDAVLRLVEQVRKLHERIDALQARMDRSEGDGR